MRLEHLLQLLGLLVLYKLGSLLWGDLDQLRDPRKERPDKGIRDR